MAITKAIILQLLSKFDPKGVDKATKSVGRFDKLQSKVSRRIKLGFAAASAAAVAFGQKITRVAVKAALEEERQLTSLNKTLENLGLGAASEQVVAFANTLQRTSGVSEDILRPALQSLIVTTGDVEASQELLNRALDISKGSGKDLGAVVGALNRAFSGNLTALRRLNVGLDANLLKSGDLTAVLDVLQQKFGGQTAVAAATLAGQVDKLKVSAEEATETFGNKLIVAFSQFSEGGTKSLGTLGAGLETFAGRAGDAAIGLGAVFSDLKISLGLLDESSNRFFSRIPTSFIFDYLEKRGKETEKLLELQNQLNASREDTKNLALNKQKAEAEKKYVEELKKNDPLLNAIKEAEERLAAAKKKAEKQAADAAAARKKKEADAAAARKKAEEKAAAARKKAEAEERTKKALQDKFDLDIINVQAALKRKISDEDRTRLQALKAIQTETVKDDEVALEKLRNLEKLRKEEAIANAQAVKDARKSAADDAILDAKRVADLLKSLMIDIPVRFNVIPPSGILPPGMDAGSPIITTGQKFVTPSPPGMYPESPRITTGLDKVDPRSLVRGTSGMTLEKEAAIAARKAREEAMRVAMASVPGALPEGRDLVLGQNNTNVTINVSGSVVGSQDLQREIFNAIYGGNRYGFPSAISGR
jgi:hypothetical protein